jgi:uncharacterized damage-inducible protein DinB
MPSTNASPSLLRLFQYTRCANDLVIEALRDARAGAPAEEALRLLSHLLRAQSIWWGRAVGDEETAGLELWTTDTLEACAERSARSIDRWTEVIEAAGDLTRTVRYRNSAGTAFETDLRDIAHHVVNHATHHRAQIARLLREAGEEPPASDYIYYLRSPESSPPAQSRTG